MTTPTAEAAFTLEPFKGPFTSKQSGFHLPFWVVFDAEGRRVSEEIIDRNAAQWLCDRLNAPVAPRTAEVDWVLVPREPTGRMIQEGASALATNEARDALMTATLQQSAQKMAAAKMRFRYAAMIAAAPQAAASRTPSAGDALTDSERKPGRVAAITPHNAVLGGGPCLVCGSTKRDDTCREGPDHHP